MTEIFTPQKSANTINKAFSFFPNSQFTLVHCGICAAICGITGRIQNSAWAHLQQRYRVNHFQKRGQISERMARYQKCKHFKGKIGEIGPTYWLDISIVLNVTDGGVSSIYALEVHPPLGSN